MPSNMIPVWNEDIYTINELRSIVIPIAEQHNVHSVYLFGSYARGSATSASDVDLCIDAPALKGMFALGSLYADREDALRKKLDLIAFGSLKYNTDSRLSKTPAYANRRLRSWASKTRRRSQPL